MDPIFLRELAQRCSELMLDAPTDEARRQLAMWVDEFEQRADLLERELVERAMQLSRLD